jgi:hypothetical protein
MGKEGDSSFRPFLMLLAACRQSLQNLRFLFGKPERDRKARKRMKREIFLSQPVIFEFE